MGCIELEGALSYCCIYCTYLARRWKTNSRPSLCEPYSRGAPSYCMISCRARGMFSSRCVLTATQSTIPTEKESSCAGVSWQGALSAAVYTTHGSRVKLQTLGCVFVRSRSECFLIVFFNPTPAPPAPTKNIALLILSYCTFVVLSCRTNTVCLLHCDVVLCPHVLYRHHTGVYTGVP